MKETYFVISNSDGDTHVEELTKEKLLERIEEGYYGSGRGILKKIPENTDTNYWGENILIIKGQIVAPTAEEVVTKYNIE
jgi:hypothetical protein